MIPFITKDDEDAKFHPRSTSPPFLSCFISCKHSTFGDNLPGDVNPYCFKIIEFQIKVRPARPIVGYPGSSPAPSPFTISLSTNTKRSLYLILCADSAKDAISQMS